MPLCGVSGLPIWQQGVTCSHIGSKNEACLPAAYNIKRVEQASKSATSTTKDNISQESDIVKKWDFSGKGVLSKNAEEPWNDRGKGGMISIKIPTFSLTKERYCNIIK